MTVLERRQRPPAGSRRAARAARRRLPSSTSRSSRSRSCSRRRAVLARPLPAAAAGQAAVRGRAQRGAHAAWCATRPSTCAVLERVAAAADRRRRRRARRLRERPSRPGGQPRVLPAHRLERPPGGRTARRPIRYRCCAMPSPERLTVRRVALQARRSAGDAAELVARLAAEAASSCCRPDADVARRGPRDRARRRRLGPARPAAGDWVGRAGLRRSTSAASASSRRPSPTSSRRPCGARWRGSCASWSSRRVQAERGGERLGAGRERRRRRERRARAASRAWAGTSTASISASWPATPSSSARPPGSTGYALSAGGPVLDWGVEALGVTFVAPHTLTARPLVLPRGAGVEVANRARELTRAADPRRRPERSRAGAGRVRHGLPGAGANRARRCFPRSRSCSATATRSPADARGARRREPRARCAPRGCRCIRGSTC